MIGFTAVLLLAASPAAAPAPTFCERMAQVWPMGAYKNTKGLVRRVQLKGGDGRTFGFQPDSALADLLQPMPTKFCGRARTGHGLICHVAGPGSFRVMSKRADRTFPVKSGEHAIVETDGRSIACQDRTGPADYTRFEPLD